MDKEEKILSDAYDRGKLKLEDPSDELLQLLAEAGENTFKKDKRINVRLSRNHAKQFKAVIGDLITI